MKTVEKRFLWLGSFGIFASIGIFVAVLGGIYYYNLSKWTFDERLKSESIEMVRRHAPTLLTNLSRNHRAISMDESAIITNLVKNKHVDSILYLNKFGEVRWHNDPSKIKMSFDDFSEENARPTDAIEQAWLSKSPIIRVVPDMPLYDIAIPLAIRGDVLGVLNMQISRKGVLKEIDKAMRKYVICAIGVLLLLGILLHFILRYFVDKPVQVSNV